MKPDRSLYILMVLLLWITACCIDSSKKSPQNVPVDEFYGQWTIDIEGGKVGWLEVRREKDYLDADLLWIGGSVLPVSHVYLANDRFLVATRTKTVSHKNDGKIRNHLVTNLLEVYKQDKEEICGYFLEPKMDGRGMDTSSFVGKKLPPVSEPPDMDHLQFGEPVVLFDGKDLSRWELIDEDKKNGWTIKEGVMVNKLVQDERAQSYTNIRTKKHFEDFNLTLEVKVPENSNSGVYLRGMYEIQISDSYDKDLDSHHMGALYSRITPAVKAEKPPNTWQSLDITLCDRHITVVLNGSKIIDNQPVHGPTGGAIQSNVFAPGPIYLQGNHGNIFYRNIILTPIIE
jgi:hypothetical protein